MIALIVYDGPRQDTLTVSKALFKSWLEFYERSGTTMPFRVFTDKTSGLKQFMGQDLTVIEDMPKQLFSLQMSYMNLVTESFVYTDWLASRVYGIVQQPCVVMSLETVLIENIDSIFDNIQDGAKMGMTAYLEPSDSAGYERYLTRRGLHMHEREQAFQYMSKELGWDKKVQKAMRTLTNLDDPAHNLTYDTSVLAFKEDPKEVFDEKFENMFEIFDEVDAIDKISPNSDSSQGRRIWSTVNDEIGCEIPLEYNMNVYPVPTGRPDVFISAVPAPLNDAKVVTLHGAIRQAGVNDKGHPVGIKWYYQQIYDQIDKVISQ